MNKAIQFRGDNWGKVEEFLGDKLDILKKALINALYKEKCYNPYEKITEYQPFKNEIQIFDWIILSNGNFYVAPDIEVLYVNHHTNAPTNRYIKQGGYSGEQFRQEQLVPEFEKALAKTQKLIVNIDGTIGYSPTFLEEAFGGLARVYGKETVLNNLVVVSEETEFYLNDIERYINAVDKNRYTLFNIKTHSAQYVSAENEKEAFKELININKFDIDFYYSIRINNDPSCYEPRGSNRERIDFNIIHNGCEIELTAHIDLSNGFYNAYILPIYLYLFNKSKDDLMLAANEMAISFFKRQDEIKSDLLRELKKL